MGKKRQPHSRYPRDEQGRNASEDHPLLRSDNIKALLHHFSFPLSNGHFKPESSNPLSFSGLTRLVNNKNLIDVNHFC